jgi:diguanylate cyclase
MSFAVALIALDLMMADALTDLRGPGGRALAFETIELMSAHDIPVTAANYEVWLAHKTGSHPDLSREIETLIAGGGNFSDVANSELVERFFASTRLSVQMVETSESIARELAEVVTTLRDAGSLTGSYADALQTAAATIEGELDPTNLRTVVAHLAASTREMANNNRQLSQQMELSSRQVDTLQTALQSVKLEALTDGLTGLANRRLFDETLRRRIGESEADKSNMCLLMCDIDHFKRFNDTWGHQIGDQVIRFIAAVLRQHAQGDLLAARYGGEEFAIIFPRTRLDDALAVATAIHQAIASKRLFRKSTGETIGAVTISVGLAQYRNGERISDLIGRADACLYASKRGGRDRITTDANALLSAA